MSARRDTLRVSRTKLLEFFDVAPSGSRGHATAIVAVAGEELGVALFVHYLRRNHVQASVLTDRCTPATRKGSRLDAWVEAGPVLYQVEVKNWSAHAIGGKTLAVDAPMEEATIYRRQMWETRWDGRRFSKSVNKVLEPMRPPLEHARVEPLVVFWTAVHPSGAPDPFFRISIEDAPFPVVNVFSMSSYLRSYDDDYIDLQLPKTSKRLGWLSALFELKLTAALGDL